MCGLKCCAKCYLVAINIIFMLLAIIFIAIGGILLYGQSTIRSTIGIEDMLEEILKQMTSASDVAQTAADTVDQLFAIFEGLAIAFLVLGVFMLAITIVGCAGACCTVKVLLIIYTVVVGLLLLTQIILMALYGSGVFDDEIKEKVRSTVQEKYQGARGTNFESLVFNVIQSEFECCGIDDYQDFNETQNWDRTIGYTYNGVNYTGYMQIPALCCKLTGSLTSGGELIDNNCPFYPNDTIANWKTGCFDEVRDAFTTGRSILLGVVGGFIGFEVACLAVAICLLCLDSKVTPV